MALDAGLRDRLAFIRHRCGEWQEKLRQQRVETAGPSLPSRTTRFHEVGREPRGAGWVELQWWAVARTGGISAGVEVCGSWEPREFPAVDSSLLGPLSPSQDPGARGAGVSNPGPGHTAGPRGAGTCPLILEGSSPATQGGGMSTRAAVGICAGATACTRSQQGVT